MTYSEAKKYVQTHIFEDFDFDKAISGSFALVALRHKAIMFPEIGTNGIMRDDADWAFIDMWGKIDSGMYGDIYYF